MRRCTSSGVDLAVRTHAPRETNCEPSAARSEIRDDGAVGHVQRIHHLIRLLPRFAIGRLEQSEILGANSRGFLGVLSGAFCWPVSSERDDQQRSKVTKSLLHLGLVIRSSDRMSSSCASVSTPRSFAIWRIDLPVRTDSFAISAVAAYPICGLSAVATAVLRSSNSRARVVIGGDSLDALDAKRGRRRPKDARRMQRVPRNDRHHHVQLELAGLAGHGHGDVTSHHLITHLIDHLGNRRVHFSRHDRRSRLHGRQDDLRQTGTRPHAQASADRSRFFRARSTTGAWLRNRRRCRPCFE